MALITIRRLQREFGMPIMRASTLVHEQRALATRRHRMLWWVAIACVLASSASSMFDLHWPALVRDALWLAGAMLVFLLIYLVHRDSREPILAAARAWQNQADSVHV